MSNLQKALRLASEAQFYVFPTMVIDGQKVPLTKNGHLDASQDPGIIEDWWRQHPDAYPGVATGMSGIVVLDIDKKNGVDGFESLEKAWLDVPDTFRYPTINNGEHLVYADPGDRELNGVARYQRMEGVDRRAGSSWVLWNGPVPDREDFEPAPEWFLDKSVVRSAAEFEGTVQEWYENLTPGEPNSLVARAIDRISEDMSHSQMVEAQYNAVRLGAEGNPGVPHLLAALENAWESRDPGNHSTPQDAWEYKFAEALMSGVTKYGDATELVKQLPEYNFKMVPDEVPDWMVVGEPLSKPQFSKVLNTLVTWAEDDMRVASILWHAPTTSEIARDWGLEFLVKRIQEARSTPEPTRENPKLEDSKEIARLAPEFAGVSLLTDEERQLVAQTPTFNKRYLEVAQSQGFANPIFTRSCSWTVLSLVFGFKVFIPVSATDKMGVNLWSQDLGYSGTGKSRSIKFRDSVLNLIFEGDNEEQGYNLGADSSPEGLNVSLLLRDRQASFFASDEAARFFKRMLSRDWMSGLDDTLSHWYEGRIDPSSKLNLKELRGKSALTSFNIQMFGTPGRMTEVMTRDMFLTGFLARFHWVIGEPPVQSDDRYRLHQQREHVEFYGVAPEIEELALDLYHAANLRGPDPKPILATDEALERMTQAYLKMDKTARLREHYDLTEPSITRLMETMRKCAALTAAYRGADEVELVDALVAIEALEEWFENLFEVAAMISASIFQQECDQIEAWLATQQGGASRARLLNRFGSMIRFNVAELDGRIQFLVDSGRVNRESKDGIGVTYTINGGG